MRTPKAQLESDALPMKPTPADAGMWEIWIDHDSARYRVAVVRDWISSAGSEEPPFPYFEWSTWITYADDKPSGDLERRLTDRAADAACSVLLQMQREALRYQPLRLSGRVEL